MITLDRSLYSLEKPYSAIDFSWPRGFYIYILAQSHCRRLCYLPRQSIFYTIDQRHSTSLIIRTSEIEAVVRTKWIQVPYAFTMLLGWYTNYWHTKATSFGVSGELVSNNSRIKCATCYHTSIDVSIYFFNLRAFALLFSDATYRGSLIQRVFP